MELEVQERERGGLDRCRNSAVVGRPQQNRGPDTSRDVVGHVTARNIDQVAAVIVNFNGGDLLTATISAVLSSSVPVEVVVVDNASEDDSLDRLLAIYGSHPRLKVVRSRKNIGFARAANLALQDADTAFVLLLNPDCIVEPDTLERLLPLLERDGEIGMVGCLIRNGDGTEQAGCRRAVPTPWRSLVRVFHLDRLFPQHPRFRNFVLSREPLPGEPACVEAISGAFMLVRREALEQVGPLDEGYFLHCEDLDWCFRFRAAGWKILFAPAVEVVHFGGVCSADRPIFVHWHKHKGMIRFYRKFFRHQYPLPLMALVVTAVWGRFAVFAARDLLKRVTRAARTAGVRRTAIMTARVSPSVDRRGSGSNQRYTGPERRVESGNPAKRSEAA